MSAVTEPVRMLEDAAAVELKRKVNSIRAHRDVSADDALLMATRWQEQETGQPDSNVYYYRVWYRRGDNAAQHHECVIVRSDTQLYHWSAIYSYLAQRIRETQDSQCTVVATFVKSTPDW